MGEIKKKWLGEVDIMRAFGILAVLGIHATGQVVNLSKTSKAFTIISGVNSFLYFAVPLFLFISAMVLAHKYLKEERTDWIKFYKSRLNQIIIPYLFWTIIYLLFRAFIMGEKFPVLGTASFVDDLRYFIKILILGKGYFHLYFISIIIQFYILFPIIIASVRVLSKCWQKLFPIPKTASKPIAVKVLGIIGLMLVLLLLQYGFTLINKYYIYSHFKNTGVLVFSYIVPIGAGLMMGGILESWDEIKRHMRYIFYSLTIIFGIIFVGNIVAPQIIKISDSAIMTLVRNIYVTSFCFVIYDIAVLIKDNWQNSIRNLLVDLGSCSFGIYLLHLIILKSLHNFGILKISGGNTILFGMLMLLSFLITLIVSWGLVKLINGTVLEPIMFGSRKIVKKEGSK